MIIPISVPLEELSATCWHLRQALDDAKHTTTPEGDLRRAATVYIEAVYAYQIAKYGKVRQRLSVAALLR